MIKGVIFDMDGTMFDTEPISAWAWKKAGKSKGYEITDEMVRSFLGKNMTAIQAILRQEFGPETETEAIAQARQAYYQAYIQEQGVPQKEGLVALLEYLKNQKIPAAVSTSTDRETGEMVIKKAGVYEYYTAFVYGDMVDRSKPAPDIFWEAEKQLGLEPKDCLVIEDSPSGVLAGKAAGGYTIYIPDLMQLTEEVKEGIAAELRNLSEVIDWIERENKDA